MYSSLMGSFDFMALIHHIHTISNESSSLMRFIHFCTSYFNDSWTLPSPTMSYKGHSHIGMEIPLSAIEVVYRDILDTIANPNPSSSLMNEVDPFLEPVWAAQSTCSCDCFDDNLPLDESILEAISSPDRPWDDIHHRSYFLP
jgi:hypothetical protein